MIREYAQIHQGWKQPTAIGDDAFIMNQVYVAHDCVLEDGVTLASSVLLAGHVHVGDRANLGLGTAVHQCRYVGRGAMVGMSSVVTRDIPPFAKAYGSPARVASANAVGMRRLDVPEDDIAALVAVYESGLGPRSPSRLRRGIHHRGRVPRLAHAIRRRIVTAVEQPPARGSISSMDDRPAAEDRVTAGAPRAGARAALFLAPFAIFALLGVLWSLASPVFSVPDENAHATKAIAQVRGQVVGYTLPDVRHIVVDLPPGYEYSQDTLCFATRPDVSAGCAPDFGGPDAQPWFNTWVGAYNPVYYYLVGWPSLLFDGNASIYAMRIASSLVGAALLAWAFLAAASGGRSRWMPVGVAFAAAPMCMYLIGAVNPERRGARGGGRRLGRGPAPARDLQGRAEARVDVPMVTLGGGHGGIDHARHRSGARPALARRDRRALLLREWMGPRSPTLHDGQQLLVARRRSRSGDCSPSAGPCPAGACRTRPRRRTPPS